MCIAGNEEKAIEISKELDIFTLIESKNLIYYSILGKLKNLTILLLERYMEYVNIFDYFDEYHLCNNIVEMELENYIKGDITLENWNIYLYLAKLGKLFRQTNSFGVIYDNSINFEINKKNDYEIENYFLNGIFSEYFFNNKQKEKKSLIIYKIMEAKNNSYDLDKYKIIKLYSDDIVEGLIVYFKDIDHKILNNKKYYEGFNRLKDEFYDRDFNNFSLNKLYYCIDKSDHAITKFFSDIEFNNFNFYIMLKPEDFYRLILGIRNLKYYSFIIRTHIQDIRVMVEIIKRTNVYIFRKIYDMEEFKDFLFGVVCLRKVHIFKDIKFYNYQNSIEYLNFLIEKEEHTVEIYNEYIRFVKQRIHLGFYDDEKYENENYEVEKLVKEHIFFNSEKYKTDYFYDGRTIGSRFNEAIL